jgi:hypothetical protein
LSDVYVSSYISISYFARFMAPLSQILFFIKCPLYLLFMKKIAQAEQAVRNKK